MARTLQAVALAAVLIFAAYFFAVGLNNVTLDFYAFRQAQVAIAVYWMTHGGPLLAYETPVLGSPWAMPWEFPAYQWLVALLSLTGLSINAAGRLVSFFFYVATLLPLYWIVRVYKVGISAFLFIAILYIASPVYMFWGRSVMIETIAVFFAALWLAALAQYFEKPQFWFGVAAVAAGSLGLLIKPMTFPAFGLLGGLLYCYHALRWWRAASLREHFGMLVAGAVLALVPLTIGYGWIAYTEMLRAQNFIGANYFSFSAMLGWNFGTVGQRTSFQFWRTVLVERVLPDVFGYSVLFAAVSLGAATAIPTIRNVCLSLLFAFLFAMLVFTNLHIVHTYYQAGNAIFLIAAVGLSLYALFNGGNRTSAMLLLVAVVAGQLTFFWTGYAPQITGDPTGIPMYQVARAANSHTVPTQSLLVFGTDWSSEVPYYAERKAFAVPAWAPPQLIAALLTDPAPYLKGYPLGAIVDCYPADSPSRQAAIVRAALSDNVVLATFGGCRLLAPRKG